MELFDPKENKAVEVHEDHVHAAIQAGYRYRQGTRIPIMVDGVVSTIPAENLAASDKVVSQDELNKAKLQKEYGDTAHAAEAFGINALDTATLGASNFVAGALGPKGTKERIRNTLAANPTAATAGTVAGMAIPIAADIATGGAATPLVAPELAGAAARLGLGGAELARGASLAVRGAEAAELATIGKTAGAATRAADVVAAPLRSVTAAGDAVKAGLQKMIGTEATSLPGKAIQAVLPHAAKTATEGAIFGAANHIGDESLQEDPHILGEKMFHAIGYGALLGGAMGVGEKALGSLIPKIGKAVLGGSDKDASLAEKQAIKSISPTVAHVKAIERAGGEKAVAKRLLDAEMPAAPGMPAEKVLKAGMSVDDIAPRLHVALDEAGGKSGKMLDQAAEHATAAAKKYTPEEANEAFTRLREAEPHVADEIHRSAVAKMVDDFQPKVGRVFDQLDKDVLPRLQVLPSMNAGAIAKVESLKADIKAMASAAKNDFGEPSLSFEKAHELRKRIDDAIKWNTNPMMPVNEMTDALKGVRRSLESEIERAGDVAAKEAARISPKANADWLKDYQETKQAYRQLKVASQAADHAVDLKNARRVMSPSDYGIGGVGSAVGAIAGSAEHGLIGGGIGSLLGGAVMGAAHKVLRERGNSTAAVLLNKAAISKEMIRAVTHVNTQIARGINAILETPDRTEIPKVRGATKPDIHRDFEEKSNAVIKAASEAQGHQGMDEHAALIGQHNPAVGAGLENTTLSTTVYLVNAMPKASVPANSLQPNLETHGPSDIAKAQWLDKFTGATDPHATLGHVKNGTITQPMVDAMKACSPGVYGQISEGIRKKAATQTKAIPYTTQVSLKRFLGDPTIGSSLGVALQANYKAPAAKHGKLPAHGGPASNMGLGSAIR